MSTAADPSMEDQGREQALAALVRRFGSSKLGREFGLHRVRGVADFRATVPLFDRRSHAREVEPELGFGEGDPKDSGPVDGAWQSTRPWAVWSSQTQNWPPQRVLSLRRETQGTEAARIRREDLAVPGGRAPAFRGPDGLHDLREMQEALTEFAPDTLVVSSLALCRSLERLGRCQLERLAPSLKVILTEHDFEVGLRTRASVLNLGWIERAGRVAIPSAHGPRSAMSLTGRDLIVELLPWTDPDKDGRSQPSDATVLPEHAVLGARYEVVLSAPTGMLRRRSGAHIRVIGFEPPSQADPGLRPRFVRRLPPPADLRVEGTTLAGARLTAAVRQAFQPEDPALVSAWISVRHSDRSSVTAHESDGRDLTSATFFEDTELGRPVPGPRLGRRADTVTVRVEVQGVAPPRLPRDLSYRVDRDLRRRSAPYAHLRDGGVLQAPEVRICAPGTTQAEQIERELALDGPVRGAAIRVEVSSVA